MPASRRGLAILMVLIVVAGGGWIAATRVVDAGQAGRPPAPQVGHPAPDFTLTTVDGEMIALSELRGRPVLVNFWAIWCPPCRSEMPDIQKAYDEYAETGLAILAVDQQETQADVQLFGEQLGLDFPLLLDPNGLVGDQYLVRALPTSYFIDRQGVIRARFTGPMTAPILKDHLRAILP